MADKYKVQLDLPGHNTNGPLSEQGYLSPMKAAFIPRSVRLEVASLGKLPDAPIKKTVEAVVLLADISGFTALGEKKSIRVV